MQAAPLRVEKNLARAGRLLERVAGAGAQLVVLPEMFNVGFYFGEELMAHAEPLDGPTVAWLRRRAAEYQIYITASFYERFEGDFFNTMVMVGSDGSLQYYRKRNPTWQERAVWTRSETPGPGIFDTPFGRVGGAICFDAFSRETAEGFAQSAVELVVIIALWGTIRPHGWRPDLAGMRRVLARWSHLAAEVVPNQYATSLGVPTVFVNQAGCTTTPGPSPRFWPFPGVRTGIFDFWGRSNVRDASGAVIERAGAVQTDYCRVVSVDLRPSAKKPATARSDIAPGYLRADYYFVPPPRMARAVQEWCFRGLAREYEQRRARHAGD